MVLKKISSQCLVTVGRETFFAFGSPSKHLSLGLHSIRLNDNGLLENLRHLPRHGLGIRTGFSNFDLVAFAATDVIVSSILLALDDILAIQRMLNLTFHEDRNRLLHLVADNRTLKGASQRLVFLRHFVAAFSVRIVRTRAISRRVLRNKFTLESC